MRHGAGREGAGGKADFPKLPLKLPHWTAKWSQTGLFSRNGGC